MRYFILSLTQNATYYVAKDFNDLIKWFAIGNTDVHYFFNPSKAFKIDPKIHNFKHHNKLLVDIAMNTGDTKMDSKWSKYHDTFLPFLVQRDIMVIDEMNRTIDPRMYWYQIATYKYKSAPYKREIPSFKYRFDHVPNTRKRRRGRYYRRPRTFQERKKSCDMEIQEYINSKRNHINLINSWDDIPRNRDHSWKAKKLEKQWMKHIK